MFSVGVSSGIIENFGYVRLAELGAGDKRHGNCLGVCRIVSSLAGGPMFWYSGKIASYVGVTGIMCWSLFSYVLRFFIYSMVRNPWHALPAEALRGFTFALFWSASTFYVFKAAPPGLAATMVSSFISALSQLQFECRYYASLFNVQLTHVFIHFPLHHTY